LREACGREAREGGDTCEGEPDAHGDTITRQRMRRKTPPARRLPVADRWVWLNVRLS
jgi:hypothetical protein